MSRTLNALWDDEGREPDAVLTFDRFTFRLWVEDRCGRCRYRWVRSSGPDAGRFGREGDARDRAAAFSVAIRQIGQQISRYLYAEMRKRGPS